jgi:hypothetical protein
MCDGEAGTGAGTSRIGNEASGGVRIRTDAEWPSKESKEKPGKRLEMRF